MRHGISGIILASGILVVVGCTRSDRLKQEHERVNDRVMATQPASADACPRCAGTQLATANGICPQCGTSVR